MIEKAPQNFFSKTFCVLLVVIAFAFMYQPWGISNIDLRGDEGFYALNMNEADFSSYPVTTAFGVKVRNGYFLYPYLCRVVQDAFNCSIETALRGVSLFWALAIAVTAGITATIMRTFKAGLVAFSVFMGAHFVFEKSCFANSMTMAVFFVFLAQIMWVYFGFVKTKWNTAWIISLSLLSIAFLCNGFVSIIYFALPLLFMHRPLKVIPKLSKKGFLVGLALLLLVIGFWLAPYIKSADNSVIDYSIIRSHTFLGILWNIVSKPFEMIVRLLPWTFILWMPFCVALRPLDESPIVSHYFRVIFFIDGLIALMNPFGATIGLMYAVAALALLCGMIYDAGVRRYSVEIRKMLVFCTYLGVIASGVILHWYFQLEAQENWITYFGIAVLFLVQASWIYFYRKQGQIWLILLSVSCSIGIFYHCFVFSAFDHDKNVKYIAEQIAAALENEVPEVDSTTPVYIVNITGLYNEGAYINHPLKTVDSLAELPSDAKVVYLLSPDTFPQHTNRVWTNKWKISYRGKQICFWRGELPKSKFSK